MSKLNLTLACWDYDRTRALMDRVTAEGVDINYLPMAVEETFFRMLRHREFDVAELSLSSYSVSLSRPEKPFIAIPVFPSRMFRHSSIYVSAKAQIREPKDLIGKRIGTPEYQMTAPVWIRGILADDYGVPVDSVTYVTGGEETPGRDEKVKLDLPPRIKIERAPAGKTLAGMLRSGEIDALHTARAPSCFTDGSGDARRLFPEFQEVERTYFKRTGIFPIMHVIAIRRDLYEKHRWIAQTLTQAFREAQALAYQEFEETAALKVMLPWLLAHVEETKREMGPDFWAYGLEPNRKVLETFTRYHHEQGLSPKQLAVEELFAPEALEAFTDLMAAVALCDTAAVEPGTALRVDRPERMYAVFNLDGTFYVTEDTCSHGPGSLSAGYIDGDVVECDFHAGCFHIPTGNAVKAPCTIPVLTFPATVRDGKVWIEAS